MCVQGSWVGVDLLFRSFIAANFFTGEPQGEVSDGDEDTPRDVTSVTLEERLGLYWTTPGECSIATPLLPWTDGGTCTFKRKIHMIKIDIPQFFPTISSISSLIALLSCRLYNCVTRIIKATCFHLWNKLTSWFDAEGPGLDRWEIPGELLLPVNAGGVVVGLGLL